MGYKLENGQWVWDGKSNPLTGAPSSPSGEINYNVGSSNAADALDYDKLLKNTANAAQVTNKVSFTTPGGQAAPFTPFAPPTPPDLTNLQSRQRQVENKAAIKQAMKDFDALEASTVAAGTQAANNAGSVYAQRMMQAGINPVASGVVAAQSKLPVYSKAEEIRTQKDNMRIEATQRADALAAQIAQTIANLQMAYSQTLADHNKTVAGYELDLNKFNAAQRSRSYEFEQSQKLERDRLAAAAAAAGNRSTVDGSIPTGNFKPGYIPSFGPIIPATMNGTPMWNDRTAATAW